MRQNQPVPASTAAPDRNGEGSGPNLNELQIPSPRPRAWQMMRQLAGLVRGPAETAQFGVDSTPAGLRLSVAELTILGTACRRPLLLEEGEDLQRLIGGSIAIVRLEDDALIATGATFDLLVPGIDGWLQRYRLWQQIGVSGLWLVPPEGEGRSVSLSPWGLNTISRAPFYSVDERQAGFDRAAEALRTVRVGL